MSIQRSSKNRLKRLQKARKERSRLARLGVSESLLLSTSEDRLRYQLNEIHRRANNIKMMMYEIVCQAENAETRKILADECCQAIARDAGVWPLKWGQGGQWANVVDDWTKA